MKILKNLKYKADMLGVKAGYLIGHGVSKSGKTFYKYYDLYRISVGVVFLFAFVSYVLRGNTLMSFVSFGFFHLHTFMNQILWKLRQHD